MASKVTARLRLRRDYSKFEKPSEIPNLIRIQWSSFQRFLQTDIPVEKRDDAGLQAVFKSVFPIRDYNGTASLEFVSYSLGEPKYDVRECAERGMTWAAPLKVVVQLVLWDAAPDGTRQIRDIEEQEVYFGEMPLMTQHGTFMVNGTERVVVSQLHRSPGVFFDHDRGKTHASGKLLYSARIIPYRGSWIDFEFDVKDILHVRIDRRRKQHATILLRALGLTTEETLNNFYKTDHVRLESHGLILKRFKPDQLEGQKSYGDVKGKGGKLIIKDGQKFNRGAIRRMVEGEVESLEVDPALVPSMVSSRTIVQVVEDIVSPQTKKVIAKAGKIFLGWNDILRAFPESLRDLDESGLKKLFSKLRVIVAAGQPFAADQVDSKGRMKAEGTLSILRGLGVTEFDVLYLRENHIGEALLKTLEGDGIEPEFDDLASHFLGKPQREALIEIYKRLRPGDPPRIETAEANFHNLFFNPERYDLSAVGRLKLNFKLHHSRKGAVKPVGKIGKKKDEVSGTQVTEGGTLTKDDIVESVRYLLELRTANDPINYSVDDIDHLGNRRVRSVGELVENQYRIGLVRMERAIKERMSIQDIETLSA